MDKDILKTAREYLADQVKEDWAEPTSVQTRKGLAAYALRIQRKVDGYSLEDAKELIMSCDCGEEFADECIEYISEANDFVNMVGLLPQLAD